MIAYFEYCPESGAISVIYRQAAPKTMQVWFGLHTEFSDTAVCLLRGVKKLGWNQVPQTNFCNSNSGDLNNRDEE